MTDQPTQALSARGPDGLLAGRYRLDGLVGRGGSAEVYRAHDTALDRTVAAKLVTVSGGEDAARVGDEARLLARLNHPGLVPVYDAGTDDNGRPWVVMELVEGETLAETIKRGPLPPDRVAIIGARLAEALAYVHGQGLVHRDVKPANVLMGRDGRVRLTDFGIARLVDAARVTATGLTVGTASYLSPEQVTGAAVTPATDVYALGLVLLECLKAEREYAGSAVETALARLHRPPVVPANLPQGWPELLRAMTQNEPSLRPSTSDVAADLARMAAGGEATVAMQVDRTQAINRTQVIDRTAVAPTPPPPPRPVSRPRPAPRPAPPPPPRSSGWKYVLTLLFVIAALAVAGFLYSEAQTPEPANQPAPVNQQLPEPLRGRLEQLQKEVRQ